MLCCLPIDIANKLLDQPKTDVDFCLTYFIDDVTHTENNTV